MPGALRLAVTGMGVDMLMKTIVELGACGHRHARLERQGRVRQRCGSGLRSQLPHRRHRVQDHFRPVRQVLLIKVLSGKVTADMSLVNARTGTPRSWAALTLCAARRTRRSRRSAAATSAPSARWSEDRRHPCEARQVVTWRRSVPRALLPHGHRPQDQGQDDKVATGLAR